MNAIVRTLEEYGANPQGIRRFDEDEPGLLPYATLLSARHVESASGDSDLAALYGVYEWQNNPLIFLINGADLRDDSHFRRIRRRVALRGDAPYLGVVNPGQLTVHRVSLDQTTRHRSEVGLDGEKIATFSRLTNERPDAVIRGRRWITDVVLNLLRESIRCLKQSGIRDEDAISLAGRALFVRFLGDRNLLPTSLVPGGETDKAILFDDAKRAEVTSQWLDDTFNGDFLPLSPQIFERLAPEALHTLGNILRRAPAGQLYLGWEHRWDYLDFAHIPVGVLSQAYEDYLRDYAPEKQRKEGGYYTPRAIAELMVRGAFHALRRDKPAHQARVLDPAVGAGVFLIASFRQLVAERWAHDGRRPDTRVLRKILDRQLVGFDTNEEALRFAALGLYLMSIELDPDPEPVEKLRFNPLRGRVLLKVTDDTAKSAAESELFRGLGSLGPAVGTEHVGRYDLVIGNPPWPTGTKLPGWSEVKQTVARIARERLPKGAPTPLLPNEPLDLSFVWRAMEWARHGAQIAFALHARLLFQQGEGMPEARRAIFGALDVTGVLNGAELRNTRVWPRISAPFCLLFARNRRPPPGAAFRFVNPRLEDSLNRTGALRVDASNAEIVAAQQITERPEILKILFRGSKLDLEVFERMSSRKLSSLEGCWKQYFGEYRGQPKQVGNGYQRLRNSTEAPQAADELIGLPDLVLAKGLPLFIDVNELPPFKIPSLHRMRKREIYCAPLLIIHKSPSAEAGRVRVAVADKDLVFSETYYGYSARGHPDAYRLVRYLALLVGSKPAYWYVLMTSGEFGFEREIVEKITIDSMPVVPFEELDPVAHEQIDPLFDALVHEDTEENWARVDAWAASVYGLRERDLQVIADTLKLNLPFAHNRAIAQAPPTPDEVAAFCKALSSELRPWARRAGADIDVRSMDLPRTSPWEVLLVRMVNSEAPDELEPLSNDWPEVLRIADKLGTTEVLLPDETTGRLWVGRLRQARYWSRSQARLVARRIVWEHLDALSGRVVA